MNSVSLIGRTGADPEMKYFDTGTSKATFRIAIGNFDKDKTTSWFECVAWGNTADTVANFVRKGQQVGIQGFLKQEVWTDKTTGKERSKVLVNVTQITLLGGGNKQDSTPAQVDDDEPPF